jgi:hypothetical protein
MIASSIAITALTAGAGGGLVAAGIAARIGIKEVAQLAVSAGREAVTSLVEKAGASAAESAGSRGASEMVYRGLAAGEDPAAGLVARAPGVTGVDPISHVAGKGASPWISTSKSLSVATEKYGENGVVGIDLGKVGSEVVDLSRGIPNGGRMSNWAVADAEVLIRDFVPPEAIVGIFG